MQSDDQRPARSLAISNQTSEDVDLMVLGPGTETPPGGFPDSSGICPQANPDTGEVGGGVVSGPAEPTPVHEPRFGDRLRAVIRHHRAHLTAPEAWTMEPIADAIDRDALVTREEWRRSDLSNVRLAVEAVVEEMRYTLTGPTRGGMVVTQDVLGAEELLERLDRIFGAREPEDGAALIARERRRQITEEGWSADHDDTHEDGELADAAACYAFNSSGGSLEPPPDWPWNRKWWKPRGPIKDLVRAGALIAAEIDRLRRRLPPEHGMTVGGVGDEEPLPEHEPAHDRRERASARNEDREGRAEGFDR